MTPKQRRQQDILKRRLSEESKKNTDRLSESDIQMAAQGLEDESLQPGEQYIERAKGGMTKGQKKIGKVMREFKAGKLHSGKKGPVVKNPKQAIAIALSEAGMSKPKKAMGGGMMYARGGSVLARGARIGRTRPTKLL